MKVNTTALGKVVLTGALVMLTFFDASAQAAEPFAAIFGDAPAAQRGVDNDAAHDDNIRLVGVQLRQHDLIDVISGYAIEGDLCIEAAPIFDALKLPLLISNDRLSGWVGHESQSVELDLKTGVGSAFQSPLNIAKHIQKTPQGWCLSLSAMTELTKIDFTYQQSTLMVIATPRETLPIEAKLERESLRQAMQLGQETARPNYSIVETPYQWLSFPTADVSIDLSVSANAAVSQKLSIEMAGDFLKTTGRLRSVDNGNGGQTLRATLGRVSEKADQFGPLRARQFSIGDITAPAQDLSLKSKTGRGAILSNRSPYSPTLFDTTQIMGTLPHGWEAELYQDERLLAFTQTPDANGNYVFSDVPLQFGYNRLTVKLFGPYGEVKERVVSQFVGSAQCPDNEFRYTVGVIDPHEKPGVQAQTNRVSSNPSESSIDSAQHSSQPYSLASVEYGLSKHISARLDASHYFQSGDYNAVLSVLGSFEAMHGGFRMVRDESGAQAYEAFLQSRWSQKTSVSARWSEFGQLSSDYSGHGPSRLTQQGRLRLDSQLNMRGYALPIQANMTWLARESGERTLAAQAVTASNFKGMNWSHTLRYSNTLNTDSVGQSEIDGTLIASKSLKGFRMRAGMNYALSESFEVNSLSASIQKNLKGQGVFQASTVYDMDANSAGFEGGYSKRFRRFTASARGGVSQSGNWQAGLNIAFALYKPQTSNFYSLSTPGLSRSGAVRLLSFEDMDNDGAMSAGDIGASGVKYIIANNLRSETADSSGVSVVSGIDSYRSTDIELQLSSLEDPFLRPVRPGRAVTLRPGQVVDIAFPLVATGDVDGYVMLEKAGNTMALAGVTVEIVDAKGRIIQTGLSEYDGYFYVEGIPAVTVYARIAQSDLDKVEGRSDAQTLDLTRENPTETDVALTIKTSNS